MNPDGYLKDLNKYKLNYIIKFKFLSVYNGSKFISECTNSLLQQTYEDFQICIVDNNSTTIQLILLNNLMIKN